MTAPECPKKGHGPMAERPGGTAEQRFCGTWFECEDGWCRNSALIASPELLAAAKAGKDQS